MFTNSILISVLSLEISVWNPYGFIVKINIIMVTHIQQRIEKTGEQVFSAKYFLIFSKQLINYDKTNNRLKITKPK